MKYYIYRNPEFNKVGCTIDPKRRMEEQQGLEPYTDFVIAEADTEIEASHLEAYYKGFYRARWDDDIYMKAIINDEPNMNELTFSKKKHERYFNVAHITKEGFIDQADRGVKFIDEAKGVTYFNGEEAIELNKIAQSSQYNSGIYFVPKAVARLRSKLDELNVFTVNQDIVNLDHSLLGYATINPCPDWIADQSEEGSCHGTYIGKIRKWAEERGLYDKGDTKTQALKLVEEVGETAKAIIKQDEAEIKDGLGDIFVVLVNLAHLAGYDLEDCIEAAWDEIKNRKGSMKNGSFAKDE